MARGPWPIDRPRRSSVGHEKRIYGDNLTYNVSADNTVLGSPTAFLLGKNPVFSAIIAQAQIAENRKLTVDLLPNACHYKVLLGFFHIGCRNLNVNLCPRP